MAKIKKQVKTVDKWKKKKWFTLFAPKLFQERPLGQTCASNADLLKGRTINVNLMTLTGNIKKQNTNVQFEVCEPQGERASTQIKKIALVPAFLKRKVKRRRDRIDSSFVCKTKDEQLVRIKPMVITLSKASRATQTSLIKKLVSLTVKATNSMRYEDLMNDIVNHKFQRNLKQGLRKTFPVLDAEIRSVVLLGKDAKKLKVVDASGEIEQAEEESEDVDKSQDDDSEEVSKESKSSESNSEVESPKVAA